jgi:dihydroxyacetone kinase phosphotransfer subunit
MVGIVIVSHSEKIAQGIVELCSQMVFCDMSIEAAGGTNDGRIGTDATKIAEAVKKVDSGDGVLILVDLGSAVMSAELALELLEEDLRSRTLVADAPIVEGSVGAAVQACIGSSLEEVRTEAELSRELHKL